MWRKKSFLLGLLVSVFLSLASLPLFSQEIVTLTMDEYNAVINSLTMAENSLKQAQRQIEQLNSSLKQQDKTLTALLNLWGPLKEFSNEQETALKSEYWRGFRDGSLIGVSIGLSAGGAGGFSLGVRVKIPITP